METILVLSLNSHTLTQITDCLYDVDVLILPHKTIYILNSLGFVLASVKVNSHQNCWIILAVGSCGAAAVCPVLQKFLSQVSCW